MDQDLEDLVKIALEGYLMLKEKNPEALGVMGMDIVRGRVLELQHLLQRKLDK